MPLVNSAVALAFPPSADSTYIRLDGSFTETNPGTNTYSFRWNGSGYVSQAGQSGTADPAAANITLSTDGNDSLDAYRLSHTDAFGNTAESEVTAVTYVIPFKPDAPVVSGPTGSTVKVAIDENDNEVTGLFYAVYVTPAVGGKNWVQTDGSVGATEAWLSVAGWASKTVTGLFEPVSQYDFSVKSRNPYNSSSSSSLSSSSSTATIPPILYDTTGAVSTLQTLQRPDGSDTVDIWYRLYDADNTLDTVTAEFRTGAAAPWITMTHITGDAGPVAASDSTTNRTLKWHAAGQIGDSMESSTCQIRLTAKDGQSNSVTLTMSSANLALDTKPPVVSTPVAMSFTPSADSTYITLDGAFTETNPGTNTFSYRFNSAAYTDRPGDNNTADPSSVSITLSMDGNDYFNAYKLIHTDDFGHITVSEISTPVYVIPYTPDAPVLANLTSSTVNLTVDENNNETSGLSYAVYLTPAAAGGNWVQANGSVGAAAAWQTKAAWGTKTITGLSQPSSQYSFSVKSRNTNDPSIESGLSVSSSLPSISPVLWDTTGTTATIQARQRTDGSDTVDVWYRLYDADNSYDTVSMEYRTSAGGAWNAVTNTAGDAGTVAASSGTTVRKICWHAAGQFGANIELNSFQVRLTAKDGEGNSRTLTMASATLAVDTKAPVISNPVAYAFTPSADSGRIRLNGSFTEGNPGTNVYAYRLNGSAYVSLTSSSDTEDPPAKDITLALDGNDSLNNIQLTHMDDYGHVTVSESNTVVYAIPFTPDAPIISGATSSTVNVMVDENNSEATGLSYAIYVTPAVGGMNWVQADGSIGAAAAWQTVGGWGTKTVTGLLEPVSQYRIQAKSRNKNGPSAESPLSAKSAPPTFAPVLTDTAGSVSTLQAYQRTDGSDTVDIWYRLSDADNAYDTVTAQYRTSGSGTWSPIMAMKGDTGVVSATSSTTTRKIRWHLPSQSGYTTESGTYQIRIRAVDSEDSSDVLTMASANLSVDTKLPAISSVTPADGAGGINQNANLVISYHESVYAGTGNITIRKSGDNSVFETIAIGSALVTGSGTNTITVNPSGSFVSEAGYFVQLDSGAFKDVKGNRCSPISDSLVWNFIIADSRAPVVTVNILSTRDRTPALSGTVDDASAAVSITVGSQTSLPAVNNGNGTWTLADNTLASLTDGVYNVTAAALDPSGNTGYDATTGELRVDATAPVVTVAVKITNDRTPALSGTVDDPTASVIIAVAGQPGLAAVNNGNGTWTLADGVLSAIADGAYGVGATATDSLGNAGADVTSQELRIDATAPIVTVDSLFTSKTRPPLSGTVDDPAATLILTINGGTYAGENQGDGTWSLAINTIAPLTEGFWDVAVAASDTAGNTGLDETFNELELDLTPPVLTVNFLATKNRSPGLSGTVDDPDAVVSVKLNTPRWYTAVNHRDGTWSLSGDSLGPLADGEYDVTATAMDAAGNIRVDATSKELRVDATGPAVTIGRRTVTDNTPPLYGTINDAGAAVFVSVGGQNSLPAANRGDGTWFLADNVLAPLADGLYDVSVTAEDSLGNAGNDTTSGELYVDASPPTVTVDRQLATIARPGFTGSVDDNTATLLVTVSGKQYPAVNNRDGTWILAAGIIDPLTDGQYNIGLAATDSLGSVGLDTSSGELIVDLSVPRITVNPLATRDNTPPLSGTVDDSTAIITIVVSGDTVQGMNMGGGTWVLADNLLRPLTEGIWDVTAIAEDLAGNIGIDTSSGELVIDSLPPSVTVDRLSTKIVTPALTGTVSPVNVIVTVIAGTDTVTAAVAANGTWKTAAGSMGPFGEGVYDVRASAVDEAGNAGYDTTMGELSIDFTPPLVTVNLLSTRSRTPVLSGTVDDPETVIRVDVGSRVDLGALNRGDGTWRLSDSLLAPLADGVYNITARAFDLAGNGGVDATAGELVVDATPPVVSVDQVSTGDCTPPLSGRVNDSTSSIRIIVGTDTVEAAYSGNGNWHLADNRLGTLNDGWYDIIALAEDSLGNIGMDGTDLELAVDASGPHITIFSQLTRKPSPMISGTIDDSTAEIQVSVDGQFVMAEYADSGVWVLAAGVLKPIRDGLYDVAVLARDSVGNISLDASRDELELDATPPVVTVDSLSTNGRKPSLTGMVNDPSAVVSVSVGGRTWTAAVNQALGTWRLAGDSLTALADRIYDVTAAAVDRAGNRGVDRSSGELVVDGAAPTVSVNVLLTNNKTPILTGTIDDPGASVFIDVGENKLLGTRNNGNGTWTLTGEVAHPLADGVHDVKALAQDAFQNTAADTGSGELTVDTRPPVFAISDPAPFSVMQEAKVSWEASENLAAGVILFRMETGTAVPGSSYVYMMKANDRPSGARGPVDMPFALPDNRAYSLLMAGKDRAGNVSDTAVLKNIYYRKTFMQSVELSADGPTFISGIDNLTMTIPQQSGVSRIDLIMRRDTSVYIEGGTIWGMGYYIQPGNVLFDEPVSLVLPAPGVPLSGVNAGDVRVFRKDSGSGKWEAVFGSWYSEGSGMAYANTDRLGLFAVGVDSVAPEAVYDQTGMVKAGQPVSFEITVHDNMAGNRVRVFYKLGGGASYRDTLLKVGAGGRVRVEFPMSMTTPRGFEYYVEADDGTQITGLPPRSIQVEVENLAADEEFPKMEWNMFSVPMELGNASLQEIFSDLGKYDPLLWKVYTLKGSRYVELDSSGLTALAPGQALWMKVRGSGFRLNTGTARSVPTDKPYDIELQPGWNMISSPFVMPVSLFEFNRLLAGNGLRDSIAGPYGFSEQKGWEAPLPAGRLASLEQWKGYVIYNRARGPLTVRIPAVEYIRSSAKTAAGAPKGSWVLPVGIRTAAGNSRQVIIGVHPEASDSSDRMDLPSPPPVSEGAGIFLHKWSGGQGRYLTDYRGATETGNRWRITVDGGQGPSSLTFGLEATGLDDWEVYLVDHASNVALDVRASGDYEYMSSEPRDFTVLVGTHEYIMTEIRAHVGLPQASLLGQNFPNPAGRQTAIQYRISEKGRTVIEILDMRGRLVRTLVDGFRDPGYYSAVWDIRDSKDRPVPAGSYIYKMRVYKWMGKAASYSARKKMVVLYGD